MFIYFGLFLALFWQCDSSSSKCLDAIERSLSKDFFVLTKIYFVIFQVTSDNNVSAVCFEDYYNVTTTQDCIIGPLFTIKSLRKFNSPSNATIAKFTGILPSISQSLVCYNRLRIRYDANVSETQRWGTNFYKLREKLLVITILFIYIYSG